MIISHTLIALLAMASLSILAFFAGSKLSGTRQTLFPTGLTLALSSCWLLSGNLSWAAIIPHSEVTHWSNLSPVLISFAAGLATTASGMAIRFRNLTVGGLALMAASFLLSPIARPILAPIECLDHPAWENGVCLQTHEATCAPAATATLLGSVGIHTSEEQMVERCLTSSQGTEALGIYRGLALGTQNSAYQARIASRDPDAWQAQNQFPCVALTRLPGLESTRTVRWSLGPRAEGHAIVVLGRSGSDWLIADPAIGKVRWNDIDFRKRFTGDAIYLTQRNGVR